MIGMDFISFLILLVISVVVSGILHYGLNYYVTSGFWSFCSKVAVGWVGAWIGSPVIGHWPARIPGLCLVYSGDPLRSRRAHRGR